MHNVCSTSSLFHSHTLLVKRARQNWRQVPCCLLLKAERKYPTCRPGFWTLSGDGGVRGKSGCHLIWTDTDSRMKVVTSGSMGRWLSSRKSPWTLTGLLGNHNHNLIVLCTSYALSIWQPISQCAQSQSSMSKSDCPCPMQSFTSQ